MSLVMVFSLFFQLPFGLILCLLVVVVNPASPESAFLHARAPWRILLVGMLIRGDKLWWQLSVRGREKLSENPLNSPASFVT
jgi:hypothetical protein